MTPDDTIIVGGHVVPIYRGIKIDCNGVRVSRASISHHINEGIRASLEISEWDLKLEHIDNIGSLLRRSLKVVIRFPTTDIPPEDPYYRQVNPFDVRGILRQMWDIVKHSVERGAYPERFPTPKNSSMVLSLVASMIDRSMVSQMYTIQATGQTNYLNNFKEII